MAVCTWFLAWIISYDNTFSALMCIFIGSILFGGLYSAIYAIIKLMRKRPVVYVDQNGFTELTDLEAAGHVPWGNVKSCRLIEGKGGTSVLAIYLKDYDFLAHRFQGYERMNITRAIALHETCFFISCKDLVLSPEEIFTLFDERIFNPDR
jgi:hypothetical protein